MFRLPNLLIVGAQKCGTTYAHRVLSTSPDILGSTVKELNFFNNTNCTDEAYQEKYRSNFKSGHQRYYMESTPHYFRLPHRPDEEVDGITTDIAKSIDQILPHDDRKLIVILRNPIERAISATNHHIAMGRLPAVDLIDHVSSKYGIVNRGFYFRILEHWRPFFGDDIHVFFYDDLLISPFIFFKKICGFLEIDRTFLDSASLTKKVNASKDIARSKEKKEATEISIHVINELIQIYREDIELLFRTEGVNFPEWLNARKIASNLSLLLAE